MANENSLTNDTKEGSASALQEIELEPPKLGLDPEFVNEPTGAEEESVRSVADSEPITTSSEDSQTAVAPSTQHAPGQRFAPQDEKYLTDRAVNLDVAWEQKVRSGTEAEVRMHLRRPDVVGGGLCIWYPQQEPTYLRVQLHDRGAANNYAKTLALKGFSPPPYIPTTVSTNADDPLYIVEAPMKALAMVSNGFSCTVGLAGVNAGFFEKGERLPQGALLSYLKRGRRVTIVFDAGRANNPRVAIAEADIARALVQRGCDVSVAETPVPDGEDDLGPDDFLAQFGADAMKALIAKARPAAPAPFAKSFVAEGTSAVERALEDLPFLACLVGANPEERDAVAEIFKDSFIKKADIKAACAAFMTKLRAKRTKKERIAVSPVPATSGGQPPSPPNASGGRAPPPPPPLRFVRGDEVELAEAHLAKLGPDVVSSEGKTYRFNGRHWKELSDAKQLGAISSFAGSPVGTGTDAKPLWLSKQMCEGALKIARARITEEHFFAGASRGLGFQNGFVIVQPTGPNLHPHTPSNRNRWAYPFEFDVAASCARWQEFLETVWEGDADRAEKIAAAQEFVGAALVGLAPRFKTAITLYGESDSGKSTFLDIVQRVFPEGSICTIALSLLQNEYRRAKLAGKLLNVVAEVQSSELLESEAFKAIVAGDFVEGRPIREAPIEFRPVAAHLFAANTLPRVADKSEAVWRRWLVLTFNRRFERQPTSGQPTARNDLAEEVLATDVPGILAWALHGLARLLSNKAYTIPKSSRDALLLWRKDSNPVELFVDEEVLFIPEASTLAKLFYGRYASWSAESGLRHPYARPTFSKELLKVVRRRLGKNDVTKVVNGYTVIVGAILRNEPQTKLTDVAGMYS
jgi:P4 family phage/plasmid primase-like protien